MKHISNSEIVAYLPRLATRLRHAVAFLALVAITCCSTVVAGVNSWTTTGPRNEWRGLAVNPTDGAIYVTDLNRAYRSIDQGLHWSHITSESLTNGYGLEAFAFERGIAHRAYAVVYLGGVLQVYRTDDDGATW